MRELHTVSDCLFDRKFYRNWPVPFLAVLIRFSRVSGRIQNTEKEKHKTRPETRQQEPEVHDVIHCPLNFRPVGTGSYIICISRGASFLVNEKGILSLFWNAVSRMELPGRGLRHSGNVESLNFPGIFARLVFFKSGVQSREKRRRYIEFQKFFFARDDF